VLLTLQADVAQDYFALRALDAEFATVRQTIGFRREQLELVRSRFEGGMGSELDVARAETEFASAEAEAASIARRRSELENALGVLVGQNPSTFRLSALAGANTNWNPRPPVVPAGLPSELLERRPDVAEAERQLAAANARHECRQGRVLSRGPTHGVGRLPERRHRDAVQLGKPRLDDWTECVAADFRRRT
jgi:multidrug efflux system outer membrane protein